MLSLRRDYANLCVLIICRLRHRGFARHAEKIPAVLREASFGTFFKGTARFNDVLWTMHWEFIGSFIALAMGLVICLRLPAILQTTFLVLAATAGATGTRRTTGGLTSKRELRWIDQSDSRPLADAGPDAHEHAAIIGTVVTTFH